MHISKITYRTNAPQANYKTEHAEVSVDLSAGDDPNTAFELAKNTCRGALGLDINEDDVVKAEAVLKKARRAGLR